MAIFLFFRLIWRFAGKWRPWPRSVQSQPARPRPGKNDRKLPTSCARWHEHDAVTLWILLWQHMWVTTNIIPDLSVLCLCECSWRATWPQVSERPCRGSCWRWRVCTARSAPATPSSRPWFAGSVGCCDSLKAEAHKHTNTKTGQD